MVDQCKIGPISIPAAHLKEGNKQGADGSESFSLFLENYKARQIMGLGGDVVKSTYENMNILSNKGKWGPIPLDTSTSLLDNDNLRHRGFYLLKFPSPKLDFGPRYVELECEAEKIDDLNAYLNMDYTRGVNDGSIVPNNYSEQVVSQINYLADDFNSFDTTNIWDTPVSSGLTSPSMAVSGGKLVSSGVATTNGTKGVIYTLSKSKFTPSFKMDFNLEWAAQPAGYHHDYGFYIFPERPASYSQFNPDSTKLNWFRVVLSVSSSSVKYYIQKSIKGKKTNINSGTVLNSGQKVLSVRLVVNKDGSVEVWTDPNGGTSYSKVWGKAQPGIGMDKGFYVGLAMSNYSNVASTVKTDYVNIYTNTNFYGSNVVCLPAAATLEATPTFYRAGEDGNIPCFDTPLTDLFFRTSIDNYYSGAVLAYNSNYNDATFRVVTGNDDVLSPTKFSMDNSLVKLITDATGVNFYYWNGTAWTFGDKFTTGAINYMKMVYCSPEKCILQINRSYWTMWRGKRFVKVEHPNNSLGYTLRTCYDHDGSVSTSPGANVDITMQTLPYCNMWNKGTGTCTTPNPTDRYRLQIIKTTPCTIKSDSIPADTITGIGFYDSNISASAYDGSLYNAMEFFTQTEQIITLKRP